MDIRVKVGSRIRELRKAASLTQEALSFKAEVDKTYVNEVENGKRNVSIVNLEKIIHALGVGLTEFFESNVFAKEEGAKACKRAIGHYAYTCL